jgi:DUF1365 family protein
MIRPPCLYNGRVMHKRLRPFVHELDYAVFSLWLDIDALPRLPVFSHNRFNLYSFYDRDHGPRDGSPLRPWVNKHLAAAGYDDCVGGRVMLLCYPRMWGYVFNPLSVYFCYARDGTLRAILHEVKNTFGDQHGYLLPVTRDANGIIRQTCDKVMHVSPFMQMQADYTFTLREPDDALNLHILHAEPDGPILVAHLTGAAKELNTKNLLLNLIRYPFMTVKVILAIHVEAFKLWRKGAPYFKRPAPPDHEVTTT